LESADRLHNRYWALTRRGQAGAEDPSGDRPRTGGIHLGGRASDATAGNLSGGPAGASTVKARVYQLDTEKKMATTMPKDARTRDHGEAGIDGR